MLFVAITKTFCLYLLLDARLANGNVSDCSHNKKKSVCVYHWNILVLHCDNSNLTRLPGPTTYHAYADPGTSLELYFNSTCLVDINGGDFKPYPRLTLINLDGNKVKRIYSDSFKHCSNLEELVLSNNEISLIDEQAFKATKNLKTLDLQRNLLKIVGKKVVAKLKYLVTLNLSNNQIRFVEENAFSELHSLEVLDLSNNQLHEMDYGLETLFPSLLSLNLRGNKLQTFDGKVLKTMTKLESIDLSFNNLSCIESPDVFKIRRDLIIVQLQNNQLHRLDPDIFLQMSKRNVPPNIKFLHNNPWNCDCHAYNYWNFLHKTISSLEWSKALDVVCASPSKLQGKHLREIVNFVPCNKSQRLNSECKVVKPAPKPPVLDKTYKKQTSNDNPIDESHNLSSSMLILIALVAMLILLVIGVIIFVSLRYSVKRSTSTKPPLNHKDESNQHLYLNQQNRYDHEITEPKRPISSELLMRNRNDSGCYSDPGDVIAHYPTMTPIAETHVPMNMYHFKPIVPPSTIEQRPSQTLYFMQQTENFASSRLPQVPLNV